LAVFLEAQIALTLVQPETLANKAIPIIRLSDLRLPNR
jgi:hypothetical protein